MVRVGVAAAFLFALACASQGPEAVPIAAPPAELADLAGEWVGEYSSGESGRSGSIVFHIHGDSAEGDVLMSAPGTMTDPPIGRPSNAPDAILPEVLAIRFVQISAGEVTGSLEPYRDPACSCIVSTVFFGHVEGNTISGTYVSKHGEHRDSQQGTWRVTRERP